METIEIDGVKYYKVEDSSPIIEQYKTDMHKYKEEKSNLKTELDTANSKIKDLEIDVNTGKEKLKGVGASKEDLENANSQLADLNAKIQRMENTLSEKEELIGRQEKDIFEMNDVSKLRNSFSGIIDPDYIEDAINTSKQKIRRQDDGSIMMEGGFSLTEYVTDYAEKRPKIALAKNLKTGSGMTSQTEGSGSRKSLSEMTKQEKREYRTSNPKQYMAEVDASILKEK